MQITTFLFHPTSLQAYWLDNKGWISSDNTEKLVKFMANGNAAGSDEVRAKLLKLLLDNARLSNFHDTIIDT